MTTYQILDNGDDGIVAYLGSASGTITGSTLTSVQSYGDGTVYVQWTPPVGQASLRRIFKDSIGTVLSDNTFNVFSSTNGSVIASALAGETNGPFSVEYTWYDGPDGTGNVLATDSATGLDISSWDHFESVSDVETNLLVGNRLPPSGFTDQNTLYNTRCWLLYQNIDLPQGAIVQEARLTFQAVDATDTENPPSFRFYAEDVDNATPPISLSDFDSRTLTSALVNVTSDAWYPGLTYDFDITSIVQEIIDRPGWVAGNNIQIFWFNPTQPNWWLVSDFATASDFPSLSAPSLFAGGGGGTATASASVSLAAITASGSASFAAPARTASASVELAAINGEGSATFEPPVFDATAAVNLAAIEAVASATVSDPVFDASAVTGTASGTHVEPTLKCLLGG